MLDDIPTDNTFSAPKRVKPAQKSLTIPRFGRVFIMAFFVGLSILLGIKAFNTIGAVIWPNESNVNELSTANQSNSKIINDLTQKNTQSTESTEVKIVLNPGPSNNSQMVQNTATPAQGAPLYNPNHPPDNQNRVETSNTVNPMNSLSTTAGISATPSTTLSESAPPTDIQEIKIAQAMPKEDSKVPPLDTKLISETSAPKKKSNPKPEDILLKRASSHYALQVLAMHDSDKLKAKLKKHQLLSKAVIYRSTYQGKPWHVAIYGDYPTLAKAQEAQKKLPAEIQASKPWPRRYSSIQKAVRGK